MAGIHKHIYKRRAMIQFGEEKGIGVPFTLSEMLDYMASYKGVNGKIHKSVASTPMQLSNPQGAPPVPFDRHKRHLGLPRTSHHLRR